MVPHDCHMAPMLLCSHTFTLLIDNDICDCQNISVKLSCVYVCLLSKELFFFFSKSLFFLFLFLFQCTFVSLSSSVFLLKLFFSFFIYLFIYFFLLNLAYSYLDKVYRIVANVQLPINIIVVGVIVVRFWLLTMVLPDSLHRGDIIIRNLFIWKN